MAHVNARQWQRFSYRANVQLRWTAAECEHDIQGGVSVNLGRGGIQVRAEAAPDVGAAVSCKLWFAGDWTTLPGRVRWARKRDRNDLPNELGIEFGPLSEEQNESVAELVTSAELGGRPVKLRAAGLPEALDALAVPTDRGVRVRVPFRFFTPGSELDVELPDASLGFKARVLGAELHRRVGREHLELELLIQECEAPRVRRYTMHGAPGAPTYVRGARESHRSRADTLIVPRPRRFGGLHVLLVVLTFALAALGSAVWVNTKTRSRSWHFEKNLSGPPLAAARVSRRAGADKHKLEPFPETQVHSSTAPQDTSAAGDALASPQASLAAGLQIETDTRVASMQPSRSVDAADEPNVEIVDNATRLFVPAEGALEPLRAMLWVDPLAVVLNLHDTRVTLSRQRYVVQRGGVTALSISSSHSGTQLRVYLDAALARYEAKRVPGGVLIELRRDLRPLP